MAGDENSCNNIDIVLRRDITWTNSIILQSVIELTFLCVAAGLYSGHQGAHIQRSRGVARDPLLHGRVPLPILRDPEGRQRSARDSE